MGQVLIRNLDDAVIADYKRAAAEHGRSLEAELRAALTSARPRQHMTPDELIALSRYLRSMTPAPAQFSDSTDYIREDRDSR